MIAGGDGVAKSAFKVSLREQPSSPSLATQELDPADILEVHDVAEAIARAEALVRTPIPRSRPDLFEALAKRPTDDTAGPAVAASARISSVPPPPAPAEEPESAQAAPVAVPPRLVAPVLHVPLHVPGPEDDAYYHPGGRIRGFAEMTLDGYRPEATILVRLRQRRTKMTWWVAGALVLLTTFFGAAMITPGSDLEPTLTTASPVVRARGPESVGWASTPTKKADMPSAARSHLLHAGSVPVLDVNSLPRAR